MRKKSGLLATLLGVVLFALFIWQAPQANASVEILARGNSVKQDATVPNSYHEQAISFRTSDGVQLVGYVLGSGTKGVTLGHAHGWTLASLVPFANELVEHGYKVIMWDYRNNPPSDVVSEGTVNDRLDLDAQAAVEVLRSEGVNQIFMLGASLGGTSSIIAATQNPDLVGVGILSSPRGIGSAVFAGDAVKEVTVPSFFAVSTNDATGDYFTEVKALYEASGAKNKVFTTIDSGEHGFDMLLAPSKYLDGLEPETPYSQTKDTAPLRALNQKLLDFIDQTFGKISRATKASSSNLPPSSKTKGSEYFLLLAFLVIVVLGFIGVALFFVGRIGQKRK